jgi:DNA polymerase-3 subunit delta'
LALTSYSGRGKAVVIEPAGAMNLNASNSLLKTLEEPSGNALLILVADTVARLPATILSRCQRYNVLAPNEQEGLDWLNRLRPSSDWLAALRAAGLAPLAAIDGIELLDARDAITRDFAAVASRRAAPLKVAAQWAKLEPDFVLGWLCRLVQASIHQATGSGSDPINFALDKSVLQRIDRRKLFCYLEQLNRLRNQPKGSFNVLVTLESLLIDWANGLTDVEFNRVQ